MRSSRPVFSTLSSSTIARPDDPIARQKRAEEQQRYLQRMEQRDREPARKLDLAGLHVVKWFIANSLVKDFYHTAKLRLEEAKKVAILRWFIILMQITTVWSWTFLHFIPWPASVLRIIDTLDVYLVKGLESMGHRLEWWYDSSSVRLMWFRDGMLLRLDKVMARLDMYFGGLQDVAFAAVDVMLSPARYVYRFYDNNAKSSAFRENILRHQEPSRSRTMDTEDEDTEGWGYDDDYSDNDNSRTNSLKKGPQCPRARANTPEEKLRVAMQHRVRGQLRLMRAHSIRFSRGLVNYARQIVEPSIRPYAESFQEYYRKRARDLGIAEMRQQVQEEMKGKSLVGKALLLARTLCAAFLACLLHLVRGRRNRRRRSMRTESFRRRNTFPNPQLTPPRPVLKEEEEDSGGLLSDSGLGTEESEESDRNLEGSKGMAVRSKVDSSYSSPSTLGKTCDIGAKKRVTIL